jgi:hypothetical protein
MPGGFRGEGTFKLDPAREPKEIDIIRADDHKGMRGIYRLEGGRLTVCMGEPDDPRPTAFAPRPGTRVMLVTLRRDRSRGSLPDGGLCQSRLGRRLLFQLRELNGVGTDPQAAKPERPGRGGVTCGGSDIYSGCLGLASILRYNARGTSTAIGNLPSADNPCPVTPTKRWV